MRGVTLIELIFVLVILGVLTGIGFYAFRPNYLRNDADFVLMKLQDIRYRAIGYDKALADLGEVNESVGCFTLEDLNDTAGTNYAFRSTLAWEYGTQKFCFDRLGRLYRADTQAFQKDPIQISVKYRQSEIKMTIYPQSGYIKR